MISKNYINKDLGILIASIGAIQSLYMSIYLLVEKKKNFKKTLLSLFFITITIRIIKSILWMYLPETPVWFINFGFLTHSASGPLLWLYLFYSLNDKQWSKWSFLHFIPTLILLFSISSFTLDGFWYQGGYTVLLFHQIVYSLAALLFLLFGYQIKFKTKKTFSIKNTFGIWLLILTIGSLLLQGAYFSNYILGLTPYLLGPIVYAIFIYFLSFFAFKNPSLFNRKLKSEKYSNINTDVDELLVYKEKLVYLMTHQKPYLDHNCSLKSVSDKISLPTYIVSHTINKEFSINFSEFINSFRIKKAKELLNHKDYSNLKISSIAYECGFNSLSSFNLAFKKNAGITPSKYKKLTN